MTEKKTKSYRERCPVCRRTITATTKLTQAGYWFHWHTRRRSTRVCPMAWQRVPGT